MRKVLKYIALGIAYQLFLTGICFLVSFVSRTQDRTSDYIVKFLVFGNTILLVYLALTPLLRKIKSKNLIGYVVKIATQMTVSIGIGTYVGLKIMLYAFWFDYSLFEVQKIIATNVIMSMLILMFVLIRLIYMKEKQRVELEFNKHKINSQLLMTQAKLKPHFLFNTMTGLIKIGYENNPKKLESVIRRMSKTYRNIIDIPDDSDISVEKELALVEDYLQLEKTRLGDLLSYSIQAQDDCLSLSIPPLIIEVLVENAVIHGISPKVTGGTIDIKIYKSGSAYMKIDVTDSGMGFDIETGSVGFGVSSVYKRLKNKYGESGRMNIVSKKSEGTTITLEVPI